MPLSLRLHEIRLYRFDLRTRLPFRYGITTVTHLPHLFVQATVEIDGRIVRGIAADHLAPKWFTKDPATSFEADVAEMLTVIRHAAHIALEMPPTATPFAFWRSLYDAQAAWGKAEGLAPLLTHFGVSLVERALLDAFCRDAGLPFAALLDSGALGVDPGAVHTEMSGLTPADLLPTDAPLPRVLVRHTIGLLDPLTAAERPADAPDDGLPVTLEECIVAYGLRHFKLKVGGNAKQDAARLEQIVNVLARTVTHADWAFSVDGNESFRTVDAFRAFWDHTAASPALRPHLDAGRLLFVEQPLHRDIALSPEVGAAFSDWPDRPLVIIDESDGELSSLPTALARGYAGTSHKNCKGVFKGIVNACLIAHRRQTRSEGDSTLLLSGEDLSNVGPVALGQDLAVQAALGIASVERNGHHYFAGLSAFPADVQRAALSTHSYLYRPSPRGFPTLAVSDGYADLGTVNAAPFGIDFLPDVAAFAEAIPLG